MIFTASHLVETLRVIAARLNAASDHLCQLDGQIGDGDHGTTMVLGFNMILQRLLDQDLSVTTPGDLFSLSSETFLNTVGATAGPLYASAFQEAANFANGHPYLTVAEAPLLLAAMSDGIGARGRAKPGDKTMMDVWFPVAQHARAATLTPQSSEQLAAELRVISADGVAATKAMVASKGRAARLGERSLGHADPGASSAAIIVGCFCDVFENRAV